MGVRGAATWLHARADPLYGRGEVAWARWVLTHKYGMPAEAMETIELDQLGLEATGSRGYGPSPWSVLRRILPQEEIDQQDVFLDVGCGMGVVVLEAARRYSFGRVLGVELVPRFAAVARAAVERNRLKLRCQSVEIVTADALQFEIPADVTVAYLANPFSDQSLSLMLAKLAAAADKSIKPFRVIYLGAQPPRPLEANDRLRLVRYGRRGIRRWARAPYLRLYEVEPPAHSAARFRGAE